MLDTVLLILFLIVAIPIGVHMVRSAARQAELREPATKGNIWGLADDIQGLSRVVSDIDVSSEVDGIRKELGNLDTSVTGIGEELEILRSEIGDLGSNMTEIWEDLDGIRSDLAAMRRLLKAIAHHQWTPEWADPG
jgi:hypothetical protein